MGKVDKITSTKLRELYERHKISSPEIAKFYRCNPEYIRRLLRKYGIKIRSKSEARRLFYNINIPREQLEELYVGKKMSSPNIAKKFGRSPGCIRNKLRQYKIPLRTSREAIALSNNPKYDRADFGGDPKGKAYLIGFRLGDLHVRSKGQSILVNTNSTIPEQLELFRKLFSAYGHIWQSKPSKAGAIHIRVHLNSSFEFLLDKHDRIDPWITGNKTYFIAFLAGYSDAEGSFCLCGGKGVFSIRSQDKNIICQIRAGLIQLGILCRPAQMIRGKGTRGKDGTISNKDVWAIWVYRKAALLKLIKQLEPYSKHERKRKEMDIVKDNVLERNKKFPDKKDTKWYKLYLAEGINYVGS